jgi:hypothetical protein
VRGDEGESLIAYGEQEGHRNGYLLHYEFLPLRLDRNLGVRGLRFIIVLN